MKERDSPANQESGFLNEGRKKENEKISVNQTNVLFRRFGAEGGRMITELIESAINARFLFTSNENPRLDFYRSNANPRLYYVFLDNVPYVRLFENENA